ncbi:MAG TPA: glutamate racemase [Candidatus Sumerlaeia bacterium]|nr:glutamate racemase [Candidatus Sumerlaeia bacterium]
MKHPLIGIFDSGVGGLTVLAEAARFLPAARYLYFADSGFAPYGEKSRSEILERCFKIADKMAQRNVDAIVVACNTATSSAIVEMRQRYSFPIIGMEPALKPAAENAHDGTILVLGTAFTIREPKYQELLQRFQRQREIISLPCPGLVNLIEAGGKDLPEMNARLKQILGDLPASNISAVVLGCTHFVFLKNNLRTIFKTNIEFFDGNLGTARQLVRMLAERGHVCPEASPEANTPRIKPQIEIDTSGERHHVLFLCETLLSELMNNQIKPFMPMNND